MEENDEIHEKCEKNTFNRWGMLMRIILVKLTLYLTEKCQREKIFTISFPDKRPVKVKKN